MRCHAIGFRDPSCQGLAPNQLANVSAVELGGVPRAEEPFRGRSTAEPADDEVAKVVADTEPHDPDLGSLAIPDQRTAAVQVHVFGPDGDHLTTAQAALQHEPDGDQVAKRRRATLVELGQQCPLLIRGKTVEVQPRS